jgi:hypothetical protein
MGCAQEAANAASPNGIPPQCACGSLLFGQGFFCAREDGRVRVRVRVRGLGEGEG